MAWRAACATLVAAMAALLQPAAAQSEADIKRAMGEVAGELQQCSVYFLVLSSCVADQEPALARTYRNMADKVSDLAISGGRAAGVSDEAHAALGSLLAESMMKSMNGNCTNIAVLLKKYMNFCQRLSQDADPRLKEWAACARARQRTCGGP
jgi:hypothetical protein